MREPYTSSRSSVSSPEHIDQQPLEQDVRITRELDSQLVTGGHTVTIRGFLYFFTKIENSKLHGNGDMALTRSMAMMSLMGSPESGTALSKHDIGGNLSWECTSKPKTTVLDQLSSPEQAAVKGNHVP